ncbi:MAG: hypothetical protein A3I17_04500 [Candidatus Rokubacteria bacterium RIFCSPLOWO2_02_FULL_72_37]|nr:MAG: hypothetical protein A3I17_04500 [Candidatus Rokubacteria bacterium RIFCSPLOWO2_02_FULL_72_37]
MYAVVQIGSTIFRSECMTTFRVVSASAGGAGAATMPNAVMSASAIASRRTELIDASCEGAQRPRTSERGDGATT